MRLGILTRSLPPFACGIGDHTANFAASLRELGHEVVIIAGRGDPWAGVLIIGDDFRAPALDRLHAAIKTLKLDHIILQYTPLMYFRSIQRGEYALARTWRALGMEMSTSLIAHETYFRSWRRPQSLLRGTWEKRMLQATCRASHHVFTASEPLLSEMERWGLRREPVLLPIGSNIPAVGADIDALRASHGIGADTLILTLFGGGNNLKWMLGHVIGLERRLRAKGIAHAWLLLGGVPKDWLPAAEAVIDPGRVPSTELSAYLQMSDIFLMPHWAGLCAKRGTLMAAMGHGLPVIGTRGDMTDAFWAGVDGVELVDGHDARGFAQAVLALATDWRRRRRMGDRNRSYFAQHFTWRELTRRFIDTLQGPETAR